MPIMTSVTESKNPPAVPYASVEVQNSYFAYVPAQTSLYLPPCSLQSYPVPEAYAVPVSDMHVTTNVRSSLNLFSSASCYNILGNYRYSTDQYIHNQWNTQPVVVGQAVSMGSSSYYGETMLSFIIRNVLFPDRFMTPHHFNMLSFLADNFLVGGPAYVGNSTGGNSVVNSSSGAYASSGAPSANDVDNYSTQECYRRSNRNYR